MKKMSNKFPREALKNNICLGVLQLARTTGETKLWLGLSAKQCQNPCSGPFLPFNKKNTRFE